jgi:hypothetical protein
MTIPDTSDMIPVSNLTDPEQIALAEEATNFLTAFHWCVNVRESYLAFDCSYIIGVFLFHIEPRLLGVDEFLWVVVGDGPPAFLVCDKAPDWHSALQCYVYEMQRWVDAVRAGGSLQDIIPVNVSPTLEYADMLSTRLRFIQDHFIDDKPFPNDRLAS